MKIGILKTDAVRQEWVPRFGEYPDMFRELLGSRDPDLEFTDYDVRHGEYPESVDTEDAYVITGSRHSVYEDLPWIPPLLEFIRELHAARKKILGICFGHQLVAEALGGRTSKATQGWGMGLHRHRFSAAPQWFDDGELEFPILVSHQDQVVENPPGTQVLASSEFCPNAVCQIGDHILTLQGHPEFVNDYSREIMDFRRQIIGEDVYRRGVESLQEQPATERIARWMLNFLRGDEAAA